MLLVTNSCPPPPPRVLGSTDHLTRCPSQDPPATLPKARKAQRSLPFQSQLSLPSWINGNCGRLFVAEPQGSNHPPALEQRQKVTCPKPTSRVAVRPQWERRSSKPASRAWKNGLTSEGPNLAPERSISPNYHLQACLSPCPVQRHWPPLLCKALPEHQGDVKMQAPSRTP